MKRLEYPFNHEWHVSREGYLMTVGDRIFWDNVHSSLAQGNSQ